jgi:hypothetical protein
MKKPAHKDTDNPAGQTIPKGEHTLKDYIERIEKRYVFDPPIKPGDTTIVLRSPSERSFEEWYVANAYPDRDDITTLRKCWEAAYRAGMLDHMGG